MTIIIAHGQVQETLFLKGDSSAVQSRKASSVRQGQQKAALGQMAASQALCKESFLGTKSQTRPAAVLQL